MSTSTNKTTLRRQWVMEATNNNNNNNNNINKNIKFFFSFSPPLQFS